MPASQIGTCLALLAALLVSQGEAAAVAVTPVAKVISLLEKLEVQVEKEGKKEAAAYDKYACFCKEQVDDKTYAIERSDKKIHTLEAQIDNLKMEINELSANIADLTVMISEVDAEMVMRKEKRDEEHDIYTKAEADAAGAIDAAKRAIDALKESKGELGGKSKLETAFVQLRAFAHQALDSGSLEALTEAQAQRLGKMLGEPGKAYEYTYKSNDVIATITNLHGTFKGRKAKLDQDEFDLKTAHEEVMLDLSHQKQFAEKEKAEKEKLVSEKEEEKAAKEKDHSQEVKDMTSDQEFQQVLMSECEHKAQIFDQRSHARAAELQALAQAMEALKTGVAPNYKANKKLVGLQLRGSSAAARGAVLQPIRPVSFLQRGAARGRNAAQDRAAERARAVLESSGQALRSSFLAAAALKLQASEDHFVKVRGLIQDLLNRLEEQAAAEAEQKAFCDKAMAEAITARDEAASQVETTKADIEGKEAKVSQLKGEVAQLSKDIAMNVKALKEASEMRAIESADNLETTTDAGEGKEAVEMALKILTDFYENARFLQTGARASYVPPNSDRSGKTVADYAPEVADEEYAGSQDASHGIIGMLEVILADFERTDKTVQDNEAAAIESHTEFKTENEADTANKQDMKTGKEGEIQDLSENLLELQDALKLQEKMHQSALKTLQDLHSMCVAGEETHEERVAKREKEIEALKEAHDILENWQQ